MLALLLLAISTLLREVSESVGKVRIQSKQQSLYANIFLTTLFGGIVMGALVLAGAPFIFNLQSIPLFSLRMVLEILEAYLTILAIVSLSRSSFTFLRLTTIPLLLIVDLVLMYTISSTQVAGITIIIVALCILLYRNGTSRKSIALVLTTAVISVITISLYKYNITNFNSVAAEQTFFYLIMLLFFGLMAKFHHNENVFRLLKSPPALVQSISGGVAGVLENFAYLFAPASIILTMKRGFGVMWSIISGNRIFKETAVLFKLIILLVVSVGLVLLIV